MNQAPALRKSIKGQYLRLTDVDWQTYTRLLHVFAERPAIRLTYDRGVLEIMSPLLNWTAPLFKLGKIWHDQIRTYVKTACPL
jgi:hypothetical protein